MSPEKKLSIDELRERTERFYARYGDDLDQIRSLLEVRLRHLARAYTLENALPHEAVGVAARVKTKESFLRKLESKGWPQFYYPSQVASDLVGARVVCWFLSDANAFVELLRTSTHLRIQSDIEDYIGSPKQSGYRSIHLAADITYDSLHRSKDGHIKVTAVNWPCEIQVRTKLQDAWADITHEFHYKAKNQGVENSDLEGLLSDVSARLNQEDTTLMRFRSAYQRMADEKSQKGVREGLRGAE